MKKAFIRVALFNGIVLLVLTLPNLQELFNNDPYPRPFSGFIFSIGASLLFLGVLNFFIGIASIAKRIRDNYWGQSFLFMSAILLLCSFTFCSTVGFRPG